MKKAFDQTVRDLKREVNKKVLKVPGIEQKILDVTSNEAWGPNGSYLADIALASRNQHEYQLIMSVVWRRISDTGKNWRHVYKGLVVLQYLVEHGSGRVIDEVREHAYQISGLSNFRYIDSSGRDQGNHVRKKSQMLVALVNDKGRLQAARQRAFSNHEKSVSFLNESRNSFDGESFKSQTNGDENYQPRKDENFGPDTKNFDRHKGHSLENGDHYISRHPEQPLHENNAGAPPSYEEATRDAHNTINQNSKISEEATSLELEPTFLLESTSEDASEKKDSHVYASDKQDSHVFVPGVTNSPSSSTMDLLGSFSEDFTNSPPIPAISSGTKSDIPPVLGYIDSSVPVSFASAVSTTAFPLESTLAQPVGGVTANLPNESSNGTTEIVKASALFGSEYSGDGITNADNLGDLFSSGTATSEITEATTRVTAANIPTAAFLSDALNSVETLPNPFVLSKPSSEEAYLNPFMQSDASLQNPFLQSSLSSQQTPPNPFMESMLPSMDTSRSELPSLHTPPNHFNQSTMQAYASANHTGQFGLSSNVLSPCHGIRSDMSSQVAPGSSNSLTSQGLPLNYTYHSGSSPESLKLTQSSLMLTLPSQELSPNYVALSGLSSSATQVVGQSGIPSSSIISQGLVPTQISGLSSQSTIYLSQPGLVTAPASQGPNQIYFAQSGTSQTTENIVRNGPPAPAISHGLPPNHSPQSGLSSQVIYRPIQSDSTCHMSSAEVPSNSQSGLPLQATQNTIVCGLVAETTPSITQQRLLTPLPSQTTITTITAQPSKNLPAKFETKSTVWADSLSRGLVNLDISGVKTNPLANIGVDFDSINRKEKMVEGKSTSAQFSTITMGKAMGSGSGIGRTGASFLGPPLNPMLGPKTGMDMGMNQGIGMGINQPLTNGMAMGVGMNMNMNMQMNMSTSQGVAMQPNFGMMTMPGVDHNNTMVTNVHGFQRPYGGHY